MLILSTMLLGFILLTLAIRFAFRKQFTWGEFGVTVLGVVVIIGTGYSIAVHGLTTDTQVLSGKVTAKERNKVHCRHSYSCNCVTTCSGKGGCTTHCQTCYVHAYDIDWDILSTIGTFTIDTIDWQGLKEPPRWTLARQNDPVSRTASYTNWLKAVPDSVFRRSTTEQLPTYPDKIYDYYKIDRVVADGVAIPVGDLRRLNARISEKLIDVAKSKKVNLVVVLTGRQQPFAQELRAGWINGKKNDLVLVVGAKDYPTIDWVEAFGWSANDMVNVKTRDEVREHGKVDEQVVDIAIANIGKNWERKPMQDYEYLSKEIEPSTTAVILLTCLGLAAVAGASVYFIRNEVL